MSESPLTVAALVGSLRAESLNRAVFNSAVDVAPEHVTIVEHRFDDLTLFNQDIEDQGYPDNVAAIRAAVKNADGLLIVTPEYNGGPPGGLKNAIDWLSRMVGDSSVSAQKVGLIGVSPGDRGAASVREQLQLLFTFISAGPYDPNLGIGDGFAKVADGKVTDDGTIDELRSWMAGFAAFLAE